MKKKEPNFKLIACKVAHLFVSQVQTGRKTIKMDILNEKLDGLDYWLMRTDQGRKICEELTEDNIQKLLTTLRSSEGVKTK